MFDLVIILVSSQEGTLESSERSAVIEQYLQELVKRASDTNLKGEALHKLWPSTFAEMVRDCVLEMRDRGAFRQASLARLTETKWKGPKVHSKISYTLTDVDIASCCFFPHFKLLLLLFHLLLIWSVIRRRPFRGGIRPIAMSVKLSAHFEWM